MRTSNMLPMSVTLEVSKLSGWLNADAYCRAEREASEDRRRAGPGDGRVYSVAAAQATCREGPTVMVQGRARAERT